MKPFGTALIIAALFLAFGVVGTMDYDNERMAEMADDAEWLAVMDEPGDAQDEADAAAEIELATAPQPELITLKPGQIPVDIF